MVPGNNWSFPNDLMFLRKHFAASPLVARVAPFVIFLALTACQGQFGEASRYWFYLAKTLVGAWLVFEMRPFVAEMRAAFSWEAVAVGVGVFAMWVGLDGFYPKMSELGAKVGLSKGAATVVAAWNPHVQFGEDAALAWFFIAVRILGSSLVVPALEEVFFRCVRALLLSRLLLAEPGQARLAVLARFAVRFRVSGIGPLEETARECHRCARDHEFSAGRVGGGKRRVAVLVRTFNIQPPTYRAGRAKPVGVEC